MWVAGGADSDGATPTAGVAAPHPHPGIPRPPGTSLIRNTLLLGPYRRTVPRVIWCPSSLAPARSAPAFSRHNHNSIAHMAHSSPPWRQARGKWMILLVDPHANATRIGRDLWEIDSRVAPGWSK